MRNLTINKYLQTCVLIVLMFTLQCEEGLVEGKRPFIAPEELIYAQPVAINPVGRPIPTIPVKNPVRGTYGPAKPLPPPFGAPGKYGISHGPPRRGYGPSKPYYPGSPVRPPVNGPAFSSSSNKPFPPAPQYHEVNAPYDFDQGGSSSYKDKKVEAIFNTQGGSIQTSDTSSTGVQEHVHHHYHHNLGDNKPATVVVNSPIPAAVAAAAEAVQGNTFSSYKPSSGFSPLFGFGKNPVSGLNGGNYGGQSIAGYGGSQTSGLGSFGNLKPVSEEYAPHTFGATYAPNSIGASVGSYGSSDLYKKEFSVNGVQSNSINSEQYFGSESARAENYDCVCVPQDQCPSRDIIGRKDDLYLPLDPRNLKSDIQAEEEERVVTDGNGTMTVVRVPKETLKNSSQTEQEEKRLRRAATAEPEEDAKVKAEPVSISLY